MESLGLLAASQETQREAVTVYSAAICQYSQRCADPAWPKSYIPSCINDNVDETCMTFDCEAALVAAPAKLWPLLFTATDVK